MRNLKAFVVLFFVLLLWAWLVIAASGCTADQLNGTGDAFLHAGAAATQPVTLKLPTTQGEPPATFSFSAGAYGAFGGAALVAVGMLLKTIGAAVGAKSKGESKPSE